MADVWFYHLERQPLETVLPRILTGLYGRGERVSVHAPERKVLEFLSKRLWAEDAPSFLPHGFHDEVNADLHPVLLSTAEDAEGIALRIYIAGAAPIDFAGITRAMLFFDGNDATAVEGARMQWKAFRDQGHAIKYWKQSESGRWLDQAVKTAA
jgi:DNA polymerase III subunit chi